MSHDTHSIPPCRTGPLPVELVWDLSCGLSRCTRASKQVQDSLHSFGSLRSGKVLVWAMGSSDGLSEHKGHRHTMLLLGTAHDLPNHPGPIGFIMFPTGTIFNKILQYDGDPNALCKNTSNPATAAHHLAAHTFQWD